MKTILVTTALLTCSILFPQVGIGTDQPKALLDIIASNPAMPSATDGILIPRVDVFPLTNPTTDQHGMLVFLNNQVGINRSNFYYWDALNTKWEEIGNSLDEAYDQDGEGAGRTINADTGPVLIEGTDGLQVTGAFGSGATLDLVGAGTRMFFYPRKAALRAGGVTGTQWDDANIGDYSTAFGYNTIASGENSFASGFQSVASGLNSAALGASSASGVNSTAIGNGANATGLNSIALNGNATADGAIAIQGTSSGLNSIAIGGNVTVDNAIAVGGHVNASEAIAFGGFANGVGSITLGGTASGDGAIAIGGNTEAYSFNEVSLGKLGTEYIPASTTSFIATDRIFRIGNGFQPDPNVQTFVRQDAMVILKNGNVGFSESNPQVNLHINGAIAFVPELAIAVVGDNQLITVGNQSSILITGAGTPASNTIILSDGLTIGQVLIIACVNTDAVNGIELLDNTANTNLQANRSLQMDDTISLLWNGTKWIETYYSNN